MKRIRILEHEYLLQKEHPGMWSESGMGRSDVNTGKIALRDSLPIDMQHSTLIHEVLHQIGDITNLKFAEPEETTISVLAAGFLSFIRQNPALIAKIINNEEL